jgi:cytochrome c-type biogenesis protein CcmH/NrfG
MDARERSLSRPVVADRKDRQAAVRKRYAVAGIVVAILVASLIVAAGSRAPSATSGTSGQEAGAATLPAHPSPGSSSASPTGYAAMVRLLEARYAKHPSNTRTAMSLADAYLMTGQPARAQRLYTKVLAVDPANETAKAQLAMALHADGSDASAFDLLGSVLRSDPQSQLAHYNLAILYFSQQRSDLARDEWRKAAAIDPTSGIGRTAQSFVDVMDEGAGSGSGHTSAAKSN